MLVLNNPGIAKVSASGLIVIACIVGGTHWLTSVTLQSEIAKRVYEALRPVPLDEILEVRKLF